MCVCVSGFTPLPPSKVPGRFTAEVLKTLLLLRCLLASNAATRIPFTVGLDGGTHPVSEPTYEAIVSTWAVVGRGFLFVGERKRVRLKFFVCVCVCRSAGFAGATRFAGKWGHNHVSARRHA